MNSVIRLLAIVCLAAPAISHAQQAEMPAPTSFNVGDTWVWREVDNRTKLEDGKPTRTVVKVNGILKFSDGDKKTTEYQMHFSASRHQSLGAFGEETPKGNTAFDQLEQFVNEHIRKGRQPVGGIAVSSVAGPKTAGSTGDNWFVRVAQALVREI